MLVLSSILQINNGISILSAGKILEKFEEKTVFFRFFPCRIFSVFSFKMIQIIKMIILISFLRQWFKISFTFKSFNK